MWTTTSRRRRRQGWLAPQTLQARKASVSCELDPLLWSVDGIDGGGCAAVLARVGWERGRALRRGQALAVGRSHESLGSSFPPKGGRRNSLLLSSFGYRNSRSYLETGQDRTKGRAAVSRARRVSSLFAAQEGRRTPGSDCARRWLAPNGSSSPRASAETARPLPLSLRRRRGGREPGPVRMPGTAPLNVLPGSRMPQCCAPAGSIVLAEPGLLPSRSPNP